MDSDLACAQRYDNDDDISSILSGTQSCGSKSSFGTRSTNASSKSISALTSSVISVRTGVDSLPQQDVVIFHFRVCHIDFSEAAAGQRWKLKCRINNKTVWKSVVQKAERCAEGRSLRKNFHGNATPKIVCESGDAIELALCSPSLFGSRVVAKSALPMSEALRVRHNILNLGLAPVHDTQGKVLAHLQMDFTVTCAPLGSIGTPSLKENSVPEISTFRSESLAGEVRSLSAAKITEYDKSILEAEDARTCLESAVDARHSLQLRDRPQPNSVVAL